MAKPTSALLFEEAKRVVVGGVSSSLHIADTDEYPVYISRGNGAKLYDVDENEYIDYVGGFGPMILGYCPPSVNEAVIEQIAKGSQFASPTQSLNEVSTKLVQCIPCADLITYQGTGTEAVMVAFRFARAYTGKDKIIKFEGHYHGWADEQLVSVSFSAKSLGMLGPRNRPWKPLGTAGQREDSAKDIIVLPYNDLEIAEQIIRRRKDEIAAVILEPIMANCEVVYPEEGYLSGLRRLTTENDILLIYDEIITGFRLALGGAQEFYGITPDLSTFGKAVAGGYPLAGTAGRREIMETAVHPMGTFNANPISLAACSATLRELEKPGVYERMDRLTKRLIAGVNEIACKNHLTLFCSGSGSIWQIAFGIDKRLRDYRESFSVDKTAYQYFRKECMTKGIRLHPSRGRFYTSAAHSDEDIERTLGVMEEVMTKMSKERK